MNTSEQQKTKELLLDQREVVSVRMDGPFEYHVTLITGNHYTLSEPMAREFIRDDRGLIEMFNPRNSTSAHHEHPISGEVELETLNGGGIDIAKSDTVDAKPPEGFDDDLAEEFEAIHFTQKGGVPGEIKGVTELPNNKVKMSVENRYDKFSTRLSKPKFINFVGGIGYNLITADEIIGEEVNTKYVDGEWLLDGELDGVDESSLYTISLKEKIFISVMGLLIIFGLIFTFQCVLTLLGI